MTNKTPEQRLAELRAARSEIESAREKSISDTAVEDAIKVEEQKLADDKAVVAAEEKFGRVGGKIARVDTDLGVVIVKRPHPAIFKKFQDSGNADFETFMQLVRPCLVHPTPGAFDSMLEEQPATLARVATAVAVLAGVKIKEIAGK